MTGLADARPRPKEKDSTIVNDHGVISVLFRSAFSITRKKWNGHLLFRTARIKSVVFVWKSYGRKSLKIRHGLVFCPAVHMFSVSRASDDGGQLTSLTRKPSGIIAVLSLASCNCSGIPSIYVQYSY